jgi:hypothetical protein
MATLHSESKFLFVDLLATLTASIPTLIIAKTSTLTQLGGYSLAERFKSYVITVFSPMNSSQYQRLCRYYLQGLYDKASILLSRYQLAVWLLALSIASLASTMIPSQLNTFGAGQYDDANQAFVISDSQRRIQPALFFKPTPDDAATTISGQQRGALCLNLLASPWPFRLDHSGSHSCCS